MNNEANQQGDEVIQRVSGGLTLKEVATKYGEKVECMFYDYDNEWRKKIMVVNASFLRDMEQGAIKDCHYNTECMVNALD